MNTWRLKGECVTQGADPELFAMKDTRANGTAPAYAKTARELYCDWCPVLQECRRFADETQSVGVFGGQYREIGATDYRVYLDNGKRRIEPYTQSHAVPGDTTPKGAAIAEDLIPTEKAKLLLGCSSKNALSVLLGRENIQPARRAGNGHPNYYVLGDILRLKHKREGIKAVDMGWKGVHMSGGSNQKDGWT